MNAEEEDGTVRKKRAKLDMVCAGLCLTGGQPTDNVMGDECTKVPVETEDMKEGQETASIKCVAVEI